MHAGLLQCVPTTSRPQWSCASLGETLTPDTQYATFKILAVAVEMYQGCDVKCCFCLMKNLYVKKV